MMIGLQAMAARKDGMARFGAGDYRAISTILRRFTTGNPDDELIESTQSMLRELVDALCVMYRTDSRAFDENRFRMDALGYITVRDNEQPVQNPDNGEDES